MVYREFSSLTDEEIIFFLNDVLKPMKIENIVHLDKYTIDADIYIIEQYPDFSDTVTMTPNDLDTHDFDLSDEETYKWKQFLLAKGCNILLKDNPYLQTN